MATIADQAPALELGNLRLNEADNPSSLVARFGPDAPLLLDSGHRIDFLQIAYVQTGKTDQELEQLTQGQAKSQVLADLYWEKGAKAFNAKDYPTALGYFEKILIEFPASSLAAQAAYYQPEKTRLAKGSPLSLILISFGVTQAHGSQPVGLKA